MVIITKLLQSFLPLGVVLNAVNISANPNGLPELETRTANTALQAWKEVVVEHINIDEAILPQGVKFISGDGSQAILGTKASNLVPSLDDQTCQFHIPAVVTVARLLKTNIDGFYLPLETSGKFDPFSEADCLAACVGIPGCTAYVFFASIGECYPKRSGWSQGDLETNSSAAQPLGSVTGVLDTTCDNLRAALSPEMHQRCCDN